MALADSKKVQTLINSAAEEAQKIQASAVRLAQLRTLYQSANVNPAGTPLEGNVAAVSAWIDKVIDASDDVVANQMIAAYVPSHRGTALD